MTEIKPLLDVVDQGLLSFDCVEEVTFPLEEIELDVGLRPEIQGLVGEDVEGLSEVWDPSGHRDEELKLVQAVLQFVECLLGCDGLDIPVSEMGAKSLVDGLREDSIWYFFLELVLFNQRLELDDSLPYCLQFCWNFAFLLIVIDLSQKLEQDMKWSSDLHKPEQLLSFKLQTHILF